MNTYEISEKTAKINAIKLNCFQRMGTKSARWEHKGFNASIEKQEFVSLTSHRYDQTLQ